MHFNRVADGFPAAKLRGMAELRGAADLQRYRESPLPGRPGALPSLSPSPPIFVTHSLFRLFAFLSWFLSQKSANIYRFI